MTTAQLKDKTRLVLGDVTTTQYTDARLLRSLNDYLQKATVIAIQSCGKWEVSGELATTDINAGQKKYVFPTDLVSLKRIEANLSGATNGWEQIDIQDVSHFNGALTNANPSLIGLNTQVDVYDTYIDFVNTPTSTVVDGLKIWYSDKPTELSNDADEPNLQESLQMYLVYGAALDYALKISDDSYYQKFQNLVDRTEIKIKEYYANRLPAVRTRLSTVTNNYE